MDHLPEPTTASSWRRLVRAVIPPVVIVVSFVVIAVLVRGSELTSWNFLNPDEAELVSTGRAALSSPVPYTTWTMGTTGPTWPFVLALLGLLGFPLTLAGAHLLSAVLTGLIGAGGFLLARRTFGMGWATVLTIAWWLPLALVFPLGGVGDFGALSTEYLPSVLVIAIALIGLRSSGGRPEWLVVIGVLALAALGAKFQIAPVAAVLLVIVVVTTRDTWASRIRAVAWVSLGVVAPLVVLAIVLLITPGVSEALVSQQFGFLGSYAEGTDLGSRVGNTLNLLLGSARWYLVLATLAIIALCTRSDRWTAIARIALVASGLIAVLAGGRGFGHYVIILVVAFGIAASLPLRSGLRPVEGRCALPIAATVVGVGVAAVSVLGVAAGRLTFAQPSDVVVALSSESVLTDPDLEALCPAGSTAVVWGWAPELYIHQGWISAIPYSNILGLVVPGDYRDSAEAIVLDGVARADCVVEALGTPFFGFGPEATISSIYPEVQELLDRRFESRAAVPDDCPGCTVYVRR